MSHPIRRRFEAIDGVPTKGTAERAALLAALRWVNAGGLLWPSLTNWARTAGMDPRALRRVLRRLTARGILRVVRESRGGAPVPSRYAIVALVTPDPESGVHPGPGVPRPRTVGAATPDREGPYPGPTVRRTVMNNQENNHEQGAAVDVFSRLGIEHLRGHVNATPERLAWVEREAPSKRSPGGWAAWCIEQGWDVPAPTAADETARRKAERESRLARFDALPEAERAAIMALVRRDFTNLSNLPDDDPAVRGAVAKVLAAGEGIDARAGGGK